MAPRRSNTLRLAVHWTVHGVTLVCIESLSSTCRPPSTFVSMRSSFSRSSAALSSSTRSGTEHTAPIGKSWVDAGRFLGARGCRLVPWLIALASSDLRDIKRLPCLHSLMQTREGVWEARKFVLPLAASARVYTNFLVLPNSLVDECLHQAM